MKCQKLCQKTSCGGSKLANTSYQTAPNADLHFFYTSKSTGQVWVQRFAENMFDQRAKGTQPLLARFPILPIGSRLQSQILSEFGSESAGKWILTKSHQDSVFSGFSAQEG